MMSRVSVVIPTYNCAKFLPKAIESVLRQTYDDYEIIVVDDGSTDNTEKVLKPYIRKVNYIRQENGGVSKARNTGIKASKGTFLAFLDADDFWFPHKLQLQIKCLQKLPKVKMVFSDFSASRNNKIVSASHTSHAFNVFREHNIKDLGSIFQNRSKIQCNGKKLYVYWGNVFSTLFLGNFILPSTVLLQKNALLTVGLFDENLRFAEETEFFLRFSRKHPVAFINYPLVGYELPGVTNLSGTTNTAILIRNALDIQFKIIKEYAEFAEQNKTIIKKGISKTFNRLTYYYLSELQPNLARTSAVGSIKFNYVQVEPYLYLLLSFLPKPFLYKLGELKKKL